mgnify:FL=1
MFMKYYSQCKNTPLRAFKEAASGNLSALVIDGEVPEDTLKEAIMMITDEFNGLTGNISYKAYIQDMARRLSLERVVFMYKMCLDVDEAILKKILRMSRAKLEARISRLEFEIQTLQKEQPESEDIDVYKYYSELQVQVSKKMKFMISDDISVYNFALMVKELWQKI